MVYVQVALFPCESSLSQVSLKCLMLRCKILVLVGHLGRIFGIFFSVSSLPVSSAGGARVL